MRAEDAKPFAVALLRFVSCWQNQARRVDPLMLSTWWDQLRTYPMADVAMVLGRAASSKAHREFMPSLNAIRGYLDDIRAKREWRARYEAERLEKAHAFKLLGAEATASRVRDAEEGRAADSDNAKLASRLMKEYRAQGMSAAQAAIKTMKAITGGICDMPR